ncbi:hypothetical protein [Sphingomonas sp. ID0503]|uniref:hypothetical protein n=1 Tax=Sphingomonas sp. ID0503 TaxID=3399691 RepID=UPI003AFA534D
MHEQEQQIAALRARARRYREMAMGADPRTRDALVSEAEAAERRAARLSQEAGAP